MNQLGTEAISRCAPYNQTAAAGTALGEIFKDGLPSIPGIHLWKSRVKPYLGLSEEFLNAVFGYLPLIKDVKESAKAIARAGDIMSQYERDAGKVVRRSYYFKDVNEEEFSYTPNSRAVSLGLGDYFNTSPLGGTLVTHREKSYRRWFKGAFTYHLPSELDSWRAMMGASSSAHHLLGTSLTPEVLWELTPWSWAIDWFTNVGELINNFSNFEVGGLVMRYGYMMEESINKVTYTLIDSSGLQNYFEGAYKPVPLSAVSPVTIETVTKQRVPATPYGFGIEWSKLSTLQIAILAALGITRSS
jgi:hypothetical protein